MSTIPSVNFPAANKLQPLPTINDNVHKFVFSSPFAKGSPTWKATPKELQHHALPGPIPEEKVIFRDGLTGESACGVLRVRRTSQGVTATTPVRVENAITY